MAVVTNSIFIDCLLALLPVVYLVYWYMTNNNDYWDKRGVPNIKSGILLGMLKRKAQPEVLQEIYDKFPCQRFGGFFQLKKPVLLVKDPGLINKILVKDFRCFPDRGFVLLKSNLMSGSLLTLTGPKWRALRNKLTPTFTSGKLKNMFEQVSRSGDNLIKCIDKLSEENVEVDTKKFLFEFTLDVISSCAFGLQFKPESPEFQKFKASVEVMAKATLSQFFKLFLASVSPKLADVLNIKQFPQDLEDYFITLTKINLEYRKCNNIERSDYFQLLLTLKGLEESGKDMGLSMSDATEEDAIVNQMQYTGPEEPATSDNKLFTEQTICANSVIFLTAGSESVSGAITTVLLKLTEHPNVQLRLQQEVDTVLARHSTWTYEAVKEMTYLDQVVQESQRLYPAMPIMMRECVQPYNAPDSDLVIEKGVLIAIPAWALHRDPQYYPDPDEFKPERFEGNNFKPSSTYLPFGDGPRMCIAMRFAVLEVKTCVARIMSKYSVKLGSKTQLPIQLDPKSFIPAVKGGVWLTFTKRSVT